MTRPLLLPAALLIVLLVQLPTLSYSWYNDDYVPFADILRSGSSLQYAIDVLLVQDETPNWRVVPSLTYLVGFRLFGLDTLFFHWVSIAFHLGTCALLYRITLRVTGVHWAGAVAALLFGLHPTHVFTVGQVTSLNNVQGAFFAVATLAALVEMMCEGRRRALWYAAAIASFVLAIASNESMAIMAPVYGLTLLLLDGGEMRDAVRRAVLMSAPFAVIGAAALISFKACGCNEASSAFFGFQNADNLTFIYLGRLVWPIGLEPPTQVDTPHRIATFVLAGLIVLGAWRGGTLGRIGGLWILLATFPYIAVWTFSATRYTYQSAAGFALLVPALLVWLQSIVASGEHDGRSPRVRAAAFPAGAGRAPVVRAALVGTAAAGLFALFVWYGWQTLEQNEPYGDETHQWQRFVQDVEREFPDPERGTFIKVVGGPATVTNVYKQFHVLPAIALLTWGPGVRLAAVPEGSPDATESLANPAPGLYVARYDENGELVLVHGTPPQSTP